MKRTVHWRIILSVTPLALAVVAVAVIGASVSGELARSTHTVADHQLANLHALRDARQAVSRVRFVTARALVVSATGRTEELPALAQQRGEALGRLEEAIVRFTGPRQSEEDAGLLAQLRQGLAAYRDESDAAWAAIGRGDLAGAERIQGRVAAWIDGGLYGPFDGLAGSQERQGERLALQSAEAARRATAVLLAIGLVACAGAVLVVALLVRAELRLTASLAANQQLVAELREALDKVKTLTGLLPMCMYCKKIRDDQGYWNQIESYLATRTDALVSHGMCPDCLARHFPEVAAAGAGGAKGAR